MSLYEVFGRRRIDDPLVHVGTIHAPDPESALLLARETHFRHEEGVSYAVVPAEHVHEISDLSMVAHEIDMSYRLQRGYSGFREKREAAREAARQRGREGLRHRPVPGRPDGLAAGVSSAEEST